MTNPWSFPIAVGKANTSTPFRTTNIIPSGKLRPCGLDVGQNKDRQKLAASKQDDSLADRRSQMPEDASEKPDAFPPTRWEDLIDRIARGDREALGEWYVLYKPPLTAYLLYKFRFPPKEAEAVFHDFVHDSVIEKNCIASAKREKGRFRSFIVTTLRNYVIDRIRKMKQPPIPLEEVDVSTSEPAPHEADLEWEQARIAAALQCTQEHYEEKRKQAFWEVFWGRIVAPMLYDVDPVPFDVLIATYGFKSPQQAFNALLDAKRTFKKCLRKSSGDAG